MVFLLRLKREAGGGGGCGGAGGRPGSSAWDKPRGPGLQPWVAKDTSRLLPGAPDPP